MGMRFQLLLESRISSRGPGLHKPQVEAPAKTLHKRTHDPGTDAGGGSPKTGDRQEIAFRRTGHFPPNALPHPHTHQPTEREGRKLTERERQAEMRKRETHKHIHTQREAYSSGAATHTPRQPLRLRGSALDQNDLRLREQPTGLQADPSSRSRGHDFWGDSPEQRPGGPEAGMRRCSPAPPGPRLCFQRPGQPFAATPGIRRTSCRPRGEVRLEPRSPATQALPRRAPVCQASGSGFPDNRGNHCDAGPPLATRACALAGPSRAPLPAVRRRVPFKGR